MTSKSKLLLAGILAVAVVSLAVYISSRYQYSSQLGLAKELKKAMQAMMVDLSQAKAKSITGVPADGQWHPSIAFENVKSEGVQYVLGGPKRNELSRLSNGSSNRVAEHIGTLHMRRQSADTSMIEVRLQAQNNMSLASNFKIRMQE